MKNSTTNIALVYIISTKRGKGNTTKSTNLKSVESVAVGLLVFHISHID